MFNLNNKSDVQILSDIETELNWDARVTDSDIRVSVKDGIVTLRGTVPHYAERTRAEEVAQRVKGVRGVADELGVNLLTTYERSDESIVEAALSALKWNYEAPDGLTVTVDHGWVVLRGEAEWDFERVAAAHAVSFLMGVKGVSNLITIKSSVQPSDVKTRIEKALKRTAQKDARSIDVSVTGSQVNLTGNVHSLSEIRDARHAAWNAPGVLMVSDELKVAS